MRVWIRDESRYFKKSLRIRNLEDAKEKGRKLYYQMMGQIEVGHKIFSITMGVCGKYLEHQRQRVDGGFITSGIKTAIATQMKYPLDFIGENTKLDNIQNHKYKDYYSYRKKKHPEVKM